MRRNLIDIYHISVIPTILGKGIRLFPDCGQEIKLRLADVKSSNGITELVYQKRDNFE
ncbi:MAG TPA: dihydrofolate reductase family protein [Candidatus Enterocloster excrementipullorum]|uniref:Dihydrofolate reductase family protein n=1 Tax=Candidatus Enterocloster excrementipullorum TaxID=2838559 RepID=A0A9D2SHN7_9FIRM|nr:dihydrofolate reductase family protein [Candidatus Enterocloster excrementipullorum]